MSQPAPMRPALRLPRWRAALRRHKDTLAPATYDRYARGDFRGPIAQLLRDPDALVALAEDLREAQAAADPEDLRPAA